MSNKIKILIGVAIFLTLSTIAGTLAIYPVMDTQTRFEQYKDIYNNSNFYTGGVCKFKGGYTSLVQHSNRQFFELDEFNILQPTYVLIEDYNVSDYTGNKMAQELSLMEFQRKSITEFEPIEEYGASVRNKTPAEIIEIIKKYDLLKENPDPKNITVAQPKSSEELKQIGEQYCKQIEAEAQQQKAKEEFQKASPAEKIKLLEADIADLQKQLLETNSQLDKEYLPKTIEDYQAQIQKIKGENGIQ